MTKVASRKPLIIADAAHWIINQSSRSISGNFFIDEEMLKLAGVTDFTPYAMDPSLQLYPDLFL